MAGQSCRPAVHLVVEHSALAGCGGPPCARCRAHRLDSWRGGADVTQRAGRTGRSVSTSRLLVTSASTLVTLVPPSLAQQPDVCNTAPQQGRVERSGGNRGIYGTLCAHVCSTCKGQGCMLAGTGSSQWPAGKLSRRSAAFKCASMSVAAAGRPDRGGAPGVAGNADLRGQARGQLGTSRGQQAQRTAQASRHGGATYG